MEPLNVSDFEALARARMDRAFYDYFAGGAEDERTIADNVEAFARFVFRPRVLVGADRVDTSIDLLGSRVASPIALAPTAFNRIAHPEGEVAAARAAGAAGALMCCSTMATSSLEEIAAVAGGPLWFQLYVYRDREVTIDLVRRAEAAGYRAIVLTVDTPVLGRRERDARNQFALPAGVSISNLEPYARAAATRWAGTSSLTEYIHKQVDPSLTWESVEWLRSLTRLPLVIKGILRGDDAARAIECGASGLVVSNHGGRQLDGAIATIDALAEVVDRVAGRAPVLLDGGIRRGTDVLKGLALGASAVLIGRAYLWGLAADGESGVRRVLELLGTELALAMTLAGCPTTAAATRDLVQKRVL